MTAINFTELYTPLDQAYEELIRRRRNGVINDKVREFFGKDFPYFLADEPRLVLSRPIVTPNIEFVRFQNLITSVPVRPILLEYDAKFVSKNKDHYFAAQIHLLESEPKISPRVVRTVDFNSFEGKPITSVKTLWNEHWRDMHHRLLKNLFPLLDQSSIYNITDWFNRVRVFSPIEHYYLSYLSLFIQNGILMENFILRDHEENQFLREKVWPSFLSVCDIFGMKPLISPILPLENEELKTWLSYDKDIAAYLKP